MGAGDSKAAREGASNLSAESGSLTLAYLTERLRGYNEASVISRTVALVIIREIARDQRIVLLESQLELLIGRSTDVSGHFQLADLALILKTWAKEERLPLSRAVKEELQSLSKARQRPSGRNFLVAPTQCDLTATQLHNLLRSAPQDSYFKYLPRDLIGLVCQYRAASSIFEGGGHTAVKRWDHTIYRAYPGPHSIVLRNHHVVFCHDYEFRAEKLPKNSTNVPIVVTALNIVTGQCVWRSCVLLPYNYMRTFSLCATDSGLLFVSFPVSKPEPPFRDSVRQYKINADTGSVPMLCAVGNTVYIAARLHSKTILLQLLFSPKSSSWPDLQQCCEAVTWPESLQIIGTGTKHIAVIGGRSANVFDLSEKPVRVLPGFLGFYIGAKGALRVVLAQPQPLVFVAKRGRLRIYALDNLRQRVKKIKLADFASAREKRRSYCTINQVDESHVGVMCCSKHQRTFLVVTLNTLEYALHTLPTAVHYYARSHWEVRDDVLLVHGVAQLAWIQLSSMQYRCLARDTTPVHISNMHVYGDYLITTGNRIACWGPA